MREGGETRQHAQDRKEAINPKPWRRLRCVRDPGLHRHYQAQLLCSQPPRFPLVASSPGEAADTREFLASASAGLS